MQHVAFRAMGCQMLAVLGHDGSIGAGALSSVPHWFAAWEQQLSRFRPDSELNVLNQAGYLSSASPALWQVVQLALAQARDTGGLVTPTVLQALEAAGYDRSFDTLQPHSPVTPASHGTHSSEPSLSTARSAWTAVHCDPATRSIQLPAGLRLDLGGSVKGWAADKAVRRLAPYGLALVVAGCVFSVS